MIDLCRYCGLPTERDDFTCEECREQSDLLLERDERVRNGGGWFDQYPRRWFTDVETGWRL